MRRLRWGRIITILLVLVILGAAANFGLRYFMGAKLPTGPELSLPDAPLSPAMMSDEQKNNVIEQARQDAIKAAKASGQSTEEAQRFGDMAAEAAQRAMMRPSPLESGSTAQ